MRQKKPIDIWDVSVDNMVISKLVKIKTNSKYLIGYLVKVRRPLVLIIPWMDILRHLKLKMEIKIKTINWCLCV